MEKDDLPGADIFIQVIGIRGWVITGLCISGLLVVILLLMLLGVSGTR